MKDQTFSPDQSGNEASKLINRRNFFGTCVATSASLLYGCGQGSGNIRSEASNEASTTRQIGPDRRLAVRNECWYALDSQWLNNPNPTAADQEGPKSGLYISGYGGNAYTSKSNWAYIKTDGNNNAVRYAVTTYQGYTSNIIPGTDGKLHNGGIEDWVNSIVNDNYALGKKAIGLASSKYSGYGHGLQCPSFVSMMLYRALGGYQAGNMNALRLSSNGPASKALPGDVVFNTHIGGGWGHVAICVRNTGGIVTVVDSNYLGGDGQELIARHDISGNDISNWNVYSGRGRWYS